MGKEKEVYYWVDQSSNFGGGKNAIVYGEEMPADLSKEQEEVYLKAGWISTEKTANARQLSELDQLRVKVKELEAGNSGGISQVEVDAASSKSVQTDLDTIKDLEDLVELVRLSVADTQQGDNKEEIWSKVKEIKSLVAEAK